MLPSRRPVALPLRLAAVATFALLAAGLLAGRPGLLAGPLLDVQLPRPGQEVGYEGIELLVRFPESGRAAAPTFRALLNGADVTAGLDTAENGAHGRLHGLLDGENVLRLEVFGRARWPGGWLYEESRELRIHFRRPISTDRA